MAFQGISTPRGEVQQLLEIDGSKLVGTKVKAPFGINPVVYVLPMDNVLATKVTCSLYRDEMRVLILISNMAIGNGRGDIRPIGFPGRLSNSYGPS